MITRIQRKLLNVLLLFDLLGLQKKPYPDPAKETRIQNRRLRKLMRRAYKIPFYRARFDAAGVVPKDFRCAADLYKFPLLTKQELREWMDEECRNEEKYRDYYLDSTSGSSGTPTKILYSPREKAYNQANWIRVLIKAHYHPFRGLTASRLNAHEASAPEKTFFQKMGFLRQEFINQFEPEPKVIDTINACRPDFLYMNKTELMRIALYSKQHQYPVYHPPLYAGVGEKVDNASRKVLQEVFGPNLLDSYGTAETGACMEKLPGTTEHLIHNDLFVVNLWSEDNRPTDHGRLVVTPLYKIDIPLINYVVGDIASSRTVDGRTVIVEIEGRMNDVIQHEDGQVTTFFMIAPIFAHCEELEQVRILQKSYQLLHIQGVLDAEARRSARELEQDLCSQLVQQLRQPMDIEFEWLDVIEPEANGKLRLIVSEV